MLRTTRRVGATVLTILRAAAVLRSAPAQAAALGHLSARVCAIHDLAITVLGPAPRPGSVLVANHLGYLDPLVVCAAHAAAPIAKLEVAHWPLVGEVGRRYGVLFIARGHVHQGAIVLRQALARLGEGVSVLNFPEGTTTDGSALLPFRRGIFGVARRARAPVVPVALAFDPPSLCWTGGATFLPHYLRTAARPALGARVTFGDPIDPTGARPEAIAAAARAAVAHLLET
jgi:1-acyl-sn-glycerol-3-phosphate acyltransferase